MRVYPQRFLPVALCSLIVIFLPKLVLASGFQLWEQDGASEGLYHAGYAALANDASIAFYNPAGITRFKNPQIVVGVAEVLPMFHYKGSVTVIEGVEPFLITKEFPHVSAEGGVTAAVPDFHYVAPINDCLGFGFSVDAPFGLKTDYGRDTPLRYAATLSHLTVIDVSPSLALKLTDKASIGLGFDVQRADADFNSVAVFLPLPNSDTNSKNEASDNTGYGFHAGVLYEFTPFARAGISYHSQVVHHLTGTSRFEGPIADRLNNGQTLKSDDAKADLTLPPYTAFSVYDRITPCIGLMGSVIYTNWTTFKKLRLRNIAGAVFNPVTLIAPSTKIVVTIPEEYDNSWNVSLGAEYYLNPRIILRGALGFDQTPVVDEFRNVQLPDNDRYVVAVGAHYQASKELGLDIGWTRFYLHNVAIHPPAQVTGGQTVLTDGRVVSGANVVSAQITWDFC